MSKKDNLFERGNAARQERLSQTAARQQQEVNRKNNGMGSGVIGRGNMKRKEDGMGQRHIYGS